MYKKCCKKVYSQRGLMSHQCRLPVVVQVDGLAYCRVHDPKKTKERQAISEKRFKAKMDFFSGKTTIADKDAEIKRLNDRLDRMMCRDCYKQFERLQKSLAEARSLIDAVTEIVEIFKPKSLSQQNWKRDWLELAGKFLKEGA